MNKRAPNGLENLGRSVRWELYEWAGTDRMVAFRFTGIYLEGEESDLLATTKANGMLPERIHVLLRCSGSA